MKSFNKLILVIVTLALFTLLDTTFVKAQGSEWHGPANNESWRIVAACPWGAIIDVVNRESDTDPGNQTYEEYVSNFVLEPSSARLTPRRQNPLLKIDAYPGTPANYFAAVGLPQNFKPSLHTVPYPGSEDGTFAGLYLYTRSVLLWSQRLPIGTEILISQTSEVYLTAIVQNNEDCDGVNNAVAVASSRTALETTTLSTGYDFIPTEYISYRLDIAPSDGALQLNNIPLTTGDTFSHTQLLGNQLFYASDNLTGTDSFTYTARATFRASINSLGEQAIDHLPTASTPSIRGGASQPSISADGSAVAFTFEGINLFAKDGSVVPGVDRVGTHVYRHNLTSDSRTTTAISVTPNGDALGNNPSSQPDISWDGQSVAYASLASDLLSANANGLCQSDTNGASDIYVNRFSTNRRSILPVGNVCAAMSQSSYVPAIGGDGSRYVVAHTFADLSPVVDSDANNTVDIFLNKEAHATSAQSTLRTAAGDIATGNGGSYLPDISADGRFIVFETDATYLGEGIALADTNGARDIMLRSVVDPSASDTFTPSIRISLTSQNEQAMGGGSFRPAISRFGNHIAFDSEATNLMRNHNGFLHVYVRDQQIFEDGLRSRPCTVPLSLNAVGEPANGHAYNASISADGRFVAFQSDATNLVEGDTNGVSDIFVVDRDADGDYSFYSDVTTCTPGPRRIFRVSIASDGTQANGPSSEPDISGNGDFVAFTSAATNLVQNDTNGIDDVFVHYIGFTGEVRFRRESQASQAYLPLVQQ